jgi:putative membrane protein
MNFVIRLIISTLAVLITAYILPGVHVENFMTAVLVAIVLGCLNTFLKPLMILFALPAVVFTFGLFLIVINTFMILLTDRLVDGFSVDGFWKAFLFSVVLSIVSSILNAIKRRDEQAQS